MVDRYPEPTPTVELFTAIGVTFRRGDGEPDNIVRMVTAFYREDGEFLFEIDPANPSHLNRRVGYSHTASEVAT